MKTIRKLEKRISYCQEFKQRVEQFSHLHKIGVVHPDYYEDYKVRYLKNRDPRDFLVELDNHITLCTNYRKELVQKLNAKMLIRSYVLITATILFIMLFSSSTVQTTLLTGHTIHIPDTTFSIVAVPEPEPHPKATYEKIFIEDNQQIEYLLGYLNNSIHEMNATRKKEVVSMTHNLLVALE